MLFVLLATTLSLALAGTQCFPDNGPVLQGVDLVALYDYLDSGKTGRHLSTFITKNKDFAIVYGGYYFFFTTAENAARFNASKSTFIPFVGGYDVASVIGEGYIPGACSHRSRICLNEPSFSIADAFGFVDFSSNSDAQNTLTRGTHASASRTVGLFQFTDMRKLISSNTTLLAAAHEHWLHILVENDDPFCYNTHKKTLW